MTVQVTAYIGIGSNLGDPAGNVRRALQQLAQIPATTLRAQSDLFRSAPLAADGDDYVNAVAQLHTSLAADALLAQLHAIEQSFGRERTYLNAPRTLDLDLLLYGAQRIEAPALTVPHPRMTQRAFVLIPLLQLDPFITIPGAGPAHGFIPAVAGQVIQKITS